MLAASRYIAFAFAFWADRDAIGEVVARPRTANLADAVAVGVPAAFAPSKKSYVPFFANIALPSLVRSKVFIPVATCVHDKVPLPLVDNAYPLDWPLVGQVYAIPPNVVVAAEFERIRFPVVSTLNLVTPEAEAAIRSPEFVLLTINAELFPIPPVTERGASVFVDDPTISPLW